MQTKIQRFDQALRDNAAFARALATELHSASPWIAASMRRLAMDLDRHRAELRALISEPAAEAPEQPPIHVGEAIGRMLALQPDGEGSEHTR